MLGAHLDSWHAGTGATDNAAGSAVADGSRCASCKALDVKPRRTIRIALWSGEAGRAAGLQRAYVDEHFGTRAGTGSPREARPALRSCAVTRTGPADPQARSRAALRLLQRRQRHRQDPRGIYARAQRAAVAADLRGLAAPAPGPRRHHRDPAPTPAAPTTFRSTPSAARLPVHQDEADYETAHAPHEPRRLRPAPERRPHPGGGGPGRVHLRRGHEAGADAAAAVGARRSRRRHARRHPRPRRRRRRRPSGRWTTANGRRTRRCGRVRRAPAGPFAGPARERARGPCFPTGRAGSSSTASGLSTGTPPPRCRSRAGPNGCSWARCALRSCCRRKGGGRGGHPAASHGAFALLGCPQQSTPMRSRTWRRWRCRG